MPVICIYFLAGDKLEQYITELNLELQGVTSTGNSHTKSWADRMEECDTNWSGLRANIFSNIIGSYALTDEV